MGLETIVKKPLMKLWFPRILCAFLQKALGRLCSCLTHPVIDSHTGLVLLLFYHIWIEKKKQEKKRL